MRPPLRLLLLALAWLALCRPAPAALQATLADGSGSRPWELLVIQFSPASGEVDICVQDARGGPTFTRHVPGNAGTTWLPLPMVATFELLGTDGQWPVDIVVRDSNRVLERTRLSLTLGHAAVRRIVAAPPLPPIPNAVLVPLPADEILSAPPLIFAGCDGVYLSPELQSRMTPARALELLATGVQLIAPADQPPTGSLSDLTWERSNNLWLTPATALRPTVIEPSLNHYLADAPLHDIPSRVSKILLALGPAAIIALLLIRGLFHRRWCVLLAATLTLASLATAAILFLRATPLQQQLLAQWRQCQAADSTGTLWLEERLTQYASLFQSALSLDADAGQQLLPLATTPRQYLNLNQLQITLTGDQTHLAGNLPPRTTLRLTTRRTTATTSLPPYPKTPADLTRLANALQISPDQGWWLHNGYVKNAATPDQEGILLTRWAAHKNWTTSNAAGQNAWYELRFEPNHHYFLFPRDGMLQIIDYGTPHD